MPDERRQRRCSDPAAACPLCRGLRSAGRGGLPQSVQPLVQALPEELAAEDDDQRPADRFRRSRALDHRRRRPELAGLDPLRFPPPGADDPRQHGRADVAAGAARARLDAELSFHRHAVPRLSRLASIRHRADHVPDACWSGGSSLSGLGGWLIGWLAMRFDRCAARVRRRRRRRRRRSSASGCCVRWPTSSSWCRSTAIGRICWNMRAASRPAGTAASRPARIASSRSREPTPPTRSSWSATAAAASPRRPWWRARSSSIPISAATARASCC